MTLRYEGREVLRRDLRQRADYFANPSLQPLAEAGFASLRERLRKNVGRHGAHSLRCVSAFANIA